MSYELHDQQNNKRVQAVDTARSFLHEHSKRSEYTGILKQTDVLSWKRSAIWDILVSDCIDWSTKVTAIIEIGKGAPVIAGIFSEIIFCKYILSDDFDNRYWSLAFMENGTISDLTKLETKAQSIGEHWILTGEKQVVINCELTDQLLILAKSEDDFFAIFSIPKDVAGVVIESYQQEGLEGVKLAKITLNEVTIPDTYLIRFFHQVDSKIGCAYNVKKLLNASIAIGIAEACLTNLIIPGRQNVQIEYSFAQYQYLQINIAELIVGIYDAKLVLFDAASMLNGMEQDSLALELAQVHCSEIAHKTINFAIETLGNQVILQDPWATNLLHAHKLLSMELYQ